MTNLDLTSVMSIRIGDLTCEIRADADQDLYIGTITSAGEDLGKITRQTLPEFRRAFSDWVADLT